jgi:bacillithiol system protein YtxJ
MSQIKELLTEEDLAQVWEKSTKKPVYLFKLSTTCPISADAFTEFETFIGSNEEDVEPYFVKVRETREISNKIAEEAEIKHQSPQVLLIKDKEVLWNASHRQITEQSLGEALKESK